MERPAAPTIRVIGGGLAGSEAAWQLAERGHDVVLHEMRPVVGTEAHKTDRLGELVCSNTFKSTETSQRHSVLKPVLARSQPIETCFGSCRSSPSIIRSSSVPRAMGRRRWRESAAARI